MYVWTLVMGSGSSGVLYAIIRTGITGMEYGWC